MKAASILETIGGTPHIRVNRIFGDGANVWVKQERANPGGSIKDRIALSMVEDAERSGALKPGGTIVEPTSGNTGIGLAMVAAVKGYKLVLVMPESMSLERRRLMLADGASFDLTPAEKGMKGAIGMAQDILDRTPGAVSPSQFENPANPAIHEVSTAEEIWNDTAGAVDIVIAGVGTGGTITGVGHALKAKKPSVKMIAVEPTASPVLSGGAPGPHKIQGIGAGFVPPVIDTGVIDGVEQVSNEDAFDMARRVARTDGVPVGISSGAALTAAFRLAALPENEGKTIVTILPDFAERYLSTALFEGL